jgi:hypothetical protein
MLPSPAAAAAALRRKREMTHRWMVLAGILAIAACDGGKTSASGDESGEKSDKKKKKKKSADDDDGETKEAKDDDASKDDAKAEPTAETPEPVDDGKPPTVAEWSAQTKEVAVRGSSALNCETKMVRKWLRISCRGKSDTGGEPTSVEVVKGGGDGKTFSFASAGVTSLVLPFVEGVDVEAVFGWSDQRKMKLHVFWPRGAPEPPPKGVFSPM